ncbi:MAG TPA: glutathione S-transferase family protein [Candidatus Limnocylindrales bacterium]|nr:glutathione S-transferase family protein [Candidatus Limnocylindrales bacterium]
MKLYDSTIAPNPRRVRIFLAEKGITVPLEQVDIRSGANRQREFLAKNPIGTLPALELDDGRVLAESLAICEYFEDLHPEPALIGRTPEERAFTRMWERRMELEVMFPLLGAFRHGSPFFKGRITQVEGMVEPSRAAARKRLAWIDEILGSRPYVAGDRYTIADITLFCTIDFGGLVGEGYDPSLTNLARWHEAMKSRPSAGA